MHSRRFLRVSAALIAAACGGGGTDSSPVVPPPTSVLTTLDLSASKPTLFVGDTAQLTATPRDQNGAAMTTSVTYTSSATSVASVGSSGLVTAVGAGTTIVTATAGAKRASVSITVQLVPAATISITPGRTFILTGDTLQFAATVKDSTGKAISGYTISWTTTDDAIARINANGTLTPQKVGTVTVRGAVNGKTAESSITISVGGGVRTPELAPFDSAIPAFLAQYKLPGGSFAVMKDGRLLGVRTYGYADTTTREVVTPTSRFRFASLSKTLTSAAMMKLVEDGKVSLSDKVFTILSDLTPPPGKTADPRTKDITVLNALTHTTGWDPTKYNIDPLWSSRAAASALGDPLPATPRTLARYWLGMPLDYAPGTDWYYGQIGYVLAQLVIEKVSGKTYEQFVRENILAPAGMSNVKLGKTNLSGKLPDEVHYYYYPGDLLDNMHASGSADPAYGWLDIEANAAAAGWTGTAVDYLRFIAAIDGLPNRPDILAQATVSQMYARPLPIWNGYTTWYGLGWYSRGGSPNPVVYHGGNTFGTLNWVRRTDTGASMVLLTNGPAGPQEADAFTTAMNNMLVITANGITGWPTTDLWAKY